MAFSSPSKSSSSMNFWFGLCDSPVKPISASGLIDSLKKRENTAADAKPSKQWSWCRILSFIQCKGWLLCLFVNHSIYHPGSKIVKSDYTLALTSLNDFMPFRAPSTSRQQKRGNMDIAVQRLFCT